MIVYLFLAIPIAWLVGSYLAENNKMKSFTAIGISFILLSLYIFGRIMIYVNLGC